MKLLQVQEIDVATRPENINAVSVYVNVNAGMSAAPIELMAGASWACLDIDGAHELVTALTRAIALAQQAKRLTADSRTTDKGE